MSISFAPTVPDHEAPAWTAGQLNGVAGAPGIPADVQALIARHTAIFFEWQAAQRAAGAAEQAVIHAQRVDGQNRATALARGTAGQKAQLPDAVEERDAAQSAERDQRTALAIVEADIRASIAAHSHGWAAAIDADIVRLHAESQKAIDDLAAMFTRLAQLDAVRRQIAEPYNVKRWSAFELGMPAPTYNHHVAGGLDLLRAAAQPPKDESFILQTGPAILQGTVSE